MLILISHSRPEKDLRTAIKRKSVVVNSRTVKDTGWRLVVGLEGPSR